MLLHCLPTALLEGLNPQSFAKFKVKVLSKQASTLLNWRGGNEAAGGSSPVRRVSWHCCRAPCAHQPAVPQEMEWLLQGRAQREGGHRGKEAEVKQQIYSLEQDSISQEQA